MASTVPAAHTAWPAPRQPGINSPPLVRWLASLGHAFDATPPEPKLAERLGQWLDWTDAIALSAALNAAPALQAAAPSARARSAHEACRQVRDELARAIAQDADLRADMADPAWQEHPSFAPCRAHCRALQRKMDARIGPLRTELRAALAARSPALAQLAALDAVMDQALAARQQHLLSTLPTLLEQRFNHLPADQQAAFHHEVQSVLLAELDMRLQPALGLLDALGPVPAQTP